MKTRKCVGPLCIEECPDGVHRLLSDWGRQAYCKRCKNEYSRRRRSTPEGKAENTKDSAASHKLHPEIGRAAAQLRRDAEGKYSKADIKNRRASQNHECAYCPTDVSKVWELEHMTPIAKGGTHWPSNLAISCEECNRSGNKGVKFLTEWLYEETGRLEHFLRVRGSDLGYLPCP